MNIRRWSCSHLAKLTTVVYSGERETLCEIKDKAITLHHTIEVLAPGGHVLFKIQKHKDSEYHYLVERLVTALSPSLTPDGVKGFQVHLDKLIIDVLGDWTDRTAEFRLNQQVIARAGRENISVAATEYVDKGGDAVYGESAATRYRVDVAPGVDLVLMAIICVCLDEIVKQTHI